MSISSTGSWIPCFLALALGWMGSATAKDAAPVLRDLAGLQSELASVLGSTRAPGATWGVQVASLKSGAVWFETNSTRLFVPASNSKLFSVALALDRFGTGHVFTTTLRAAARPDAAGRLAGDLWIEGGGDPAPGRGGIELDALAPFRETLAKAGIRTIDGGIRIREGWFDAAPHGPGWNWDDLAEAYGAPVGAVVFADGAARIVVQAGARPGDPVRVRSEPLDGVFDFAVLARTVPTNRAGRITLRRLPGSRRMDVLGGLPLGGVHIERMAVPDGTEWFARALRECLIRGGIPVSGVAGVADPSEELPPMLATVPSLPLSEIAALCLKPSNNLIAHQLWLQVGADLRRHPRPGDRVHVGDDAERASGALERYAKNFGVGGNELVMEEGSGLSRKNLVTPGATVRLLRYMPSQPAGAAFRAALPIGGVDGTLRSRFSEAPLKGNVMAKTGTLRHVNALAGYLTTAGGQSLAFAIYVNGFQSADAPGGGRTEIDRLVDRLARFAGRGPE
jgi:D-alanyl-D-alanine carboxypeptidase/D-alanyl-D-alanine-endopeptidase (penicillin-binding protein 4)